jgi:hypothetical protein
MRQAVALGTILALVVLGGCAGVKDVKPGPGASETFSGRGYDDVWAAAIRVASTHFVIEESDKASGVIRGQRSAGLTSLGGYVGIFITPSTREAASYRVEVVSARKVPTQMGGREWETRILREMRDLLLPGR